MALTRPSIAMGGTGVELTDPGYDAVLAWDDGNSAVALYRTSPANRNILINGAFNVWQRQTSFTGMATGQYSADRWYNVAVGAGSIDHARLAIASALGNSHTVVNYGLRASVNTADTSIAAGDYYMIAQKIEGHRFNHVWQRPAVLSFWARSSEAGTFCASLTNNGADRSFVSDFTLSANTWTYVEIPIDASPSAGTWNSSEGVVGAFFRIALTCGTTYQTTGDAWQTGNYFATANITNTWASNATNTFDVTLIQLELGDKATEYCHIEPAQEITECERYWQKSYPRASFPGAADTAGMETAYLTGLSNVAHAAGIKVHFRTRMMTTPSCAVYSANTGTAAKIYDGATAADLNGSIDGVGECGFRAYATQGGAATSINYQFQWHANAEL